MLPCFTLVAWRKKWGVFKRALDGYMGAKVFWQYGAPVSGMYTSFKENEPNENGEEDCLASDGNGHWNDQSCYKQLQYFFVEFDV